MGLEVVWSGHSCPLLLVRDNPGYQLPEAERRGSLIGDAEHFWQKRYHDFNIRNHPQFVEKIRDIHRNPVKRGLCARPEDCQWSSFRHYATGCKGRIEIE